MYRYEPGKVIEVSRSDRRKVADSCSYKYSRCIFRLSSHAEVSAVSIPPRSDTKLDVLPPTPPAVLILMNRCPFHVLGAHFGVLNVSRQFLLSPATALRIAPSPRQYGNPSTARRTQPLPFATRSWQTSCAHTW